jgi:hypothetical protein
VTGALDRTQVRLGHPRNEWIDEAFTDWLFTVSAEDLLDQTGIRDADVFTSVTLELSRRFGFTSSIIFLGCEQCINHCDDVLQ